MLFISFSHYKTRLLFSEGREAGRKDVVAGVRMDYYEERRDGGDRERGEQQGEVNLSGSRFGNWFYCSQKGWNSTGY